MQLFDLALPDAMLWASFLLLAAGALLSTKSGYRVAAVGWAVFGLSWLLKVPEFYFVESNVLYTVLGLLALPLTLYAAYVMARFRRVSLMVITRSVAIGSLFYGIFALFPWLGDPLRSITADLTLALLHALGFPAVKEGFDTIRLNGIAWAQIILACTAIQSVAIFVGVVFSVKVEARRRLLALLISVPVIYLLNIVRVTFTIAAWGNQWLQIGPDLVTQWSGKPAEYASFFWAHNVFAEAGSLVALILISYAVLRIVPELLVYLRDAASLLKISNVKKLLRGEAVPVAAPGQEIPV